MFLNEASAAFWFSSLEEPKKSTINKRATKVSKEDFLQATRQLARPRRPLFLQLWPQKSGILTQKGEAKGRIRVGSGTLRMVMAPLQERQPEELEARRVPKLESTSGKRVEPRKT